MAAGNAVTDDEVFRRKLLMDGEGMGDDRRLSVLVKTFLKWCDDPVDEDFCIGYERLLSILNTCEVAMTKSQIIQGINQEEVQSYEEHYSKIESGIAEAQKNILNRKIDLQNSKRVRKNKQKYDALARIITNQPDRKESLRKLKELDVDIKALEKSKMILASKLEKRYKECQVLLNANHGLQHNSSGDEDDSSMEVD